MCEPTLPYPTEVLATNDLAQALAAATGSQVVYDWRTGQQLAQ